MSSTINTQLGAGSPSLQQIMSTVHNAPDQVHPLAVLAIAQIVLSEAEAGPSAIPSPQPVSTPASTSASPISANPYWHLTQLPPRPPPGVFTQSYAPQSTSGYNSFWSTFGRGNAIALAPQELSPISAGRRTPSTASSISSASSSPRSSVGPATPPSSTYYPSPSINRSSKRAITAFEDIKQEHTDPAIPALRGKVLLPFPCNRCHTIIQGDSSIVRSHLYHTHGVTKGRAYTKCIFPGCEQEICVSHMGVHVASHRPHQDHHKCSLCGRTFDKMEMAQDHIKMGWCSILQAADAVGASDSRRKRMKHGE